jgi:hypothetical protein
MTKDQRTKYNKIRWEIESLLFTQEHRTLTEEEANKLKQLEQDRELLIIV